MPKTIVALYSDPEREHIACRDSQGVFAIYKRIENPGVIYHENDIEEPIELMGYYPSFLGILPQLWNVSKTQLDYIKKEDWDWK